MTTVTEPPTAFIALHKIPTIVGINEEPPTTGVTVGAKVDLIVEDIATPHHQIRTLIQEIKIKDLHSLDPLVKFVTKWVTLQLIAIISWSMPFKGIIHYRN